MKTIFVTLISFFTAIQFCYAEDWTTITFEYEFVVSPAYPYATMRTESNEASRVSYFVNERVRQHLENQEFFSHCISRGSIIDALEGRPSADKKSVTYRIRESKVNCLGDKSQYENSNIDLNQLTQELLEQSKN